MIEAKVCPVCNGKREVSGGFYNIYPAVATVCLAPMAPETCKFCNGTGYIIIKGE